MFKAKPQFALAALIGLAAAGYGIYRTGTGQFGTLGLGLAIAVALSAFWAVGTAAFDQIRGRRPLLTTPACAALALSLTCLFFSQRASPVMLLFWAANVALALTSLYRAVLLDRSWARRYVGTADDSAEPSEPAGQEQERDLD
jgi:hypothetical protein